jgi:uncharacterized protein (TIGR02996 family)
MDEDALIDALNEAPAEPGPRMVYADWLEERGDPRSEYFQAEDRLRRAPLGDPSRRELGLAWRDRRATMDKEWLARVEPWAPVPAWVTIEAWRPPRLGLDDWHQWASESHYEWVVLAVMAPIEAVARAVIEARSGTDPESALASGRWEKDVPVREPAPYEMGSGGIPLVQLKGHAWTVAMYDTFNLTMNSYYAAQDDALALSARFGTLAVEYSAEDTSGVTGYHLFECGELIEYADDEPGEGVFASKRRRPPWPRIPRGFPDDLFRALGLYVPGFYAGGPGVLAGAPGPSDFARADVLHIGWGDRKVRDGSSLEDAIQRASIRNEDSFEVHRLGDHEDGDPMDEPDWDEEDDIPF